MPYKSLEREKEANTARISRLRAEAFPHLASLLGCRCQRCGFSDIRALGLHPLPGALPQSKTQRSLVDYHRLVLRDVSANPDNLRYYQIICANCDLTDTAISRMP